MFKKIAKTLVTTLVLSMCIGVGIAYAADNKKPEGDPIASSALRVTYDVGSYGQTTPTYYYIEAGQSVTFPTARYKRTTDEYAVHKTTYYNSINGGYVESAVHCVSDGQQATPWVRVSSSVNGCADMEYYYGYGTMGYTDRLKIRCGTDGYLDAAVRLGGQWCPDTSWTD